MKSTSVFSERFWHEWKFEKRRNTVCISSFSNCTVGAKDPLKTADDFIGGYARAGKRIAIIRIGGLLHPRKRRWSFMPITLTLHIGRFTITITVKSGSRHSAKWRFPMFCENLNLWAGRLSAMLFSYSLYHSAAESQGKLCLFTRGNWQNPQSLLE